jgi:hypothetical protein
LHPGAGWQASCLVAKHSEELVDCLGSIDGREDDVADEFAQVIVRVVERWQEGQIGTIQHADSGRGAIVEAARIGGNGTDDPITHEDRAVHRTVRRYRMESARSDRQ